MIVIMMMCFYGVIVIMVLIAVFSL